MVCSGKLSFLSGVFILSFCKCQILQGLISLKIVRPEWEVKRVDGQLVLARTFFFWCSIRKMHLLDQGQCALSSTRACSFHSIIEAPHTQAKPRDKKACRMAVSSCRCRFMCHRRHSMRHFVCRARDFHRHSPVLLLIIIIKKK